MLALVRFASVRHVYFCCYRCLLCRRSAFSETIRDVIYWVSLGSLDFRAGIVRWIRRAVFFFSVLFCFTTYGLFICFEKFVFC